METAATDLVTVGSHGTTGRRGSYRGIGAEVFFPFAPRFSEAPAPVGYVPSIVPGWDTSMAAGFGVLELEPVALRVMEGSRMVGGEGLLLEWRLGGASASAG